MTPPHRPEPPPRQLASVPGPVEIWWRRTNTLSPGRGRTLLRDAIATRYHLPTSHVTIDQDDRGNPTPLPVDGLPPLQLTAAHCAFIALAGFTADTGLDIGVDIEMLSGPPDPALLRHALSSRERSFLTGQPAPIQRAAFLRLWTAKEAVAKAIGWPLLRALVDVEITLHPQLGLHRLAENTTPRDWRLSAIQLPGLPHTITLALHGRRVL
ncbi:4'-phosphopantetheinyl transferase family protein [Streptomyces sp. NPDC057743]|uniref:4'-phosphopantetheinyl transferase family protein n=1 Tax=Streptomyces sp. NPDC057743 TaxID=3346236 RepID=UPI00369279C6